MTPEGTVCADCLDPVRGLAALPAGCVDLVFADLPYGTTANPKDTPLDTELLWSALHRVCKPAAPMVFTAMQPFAAHFLCSNPREFRFEMIWRKNKPRGFLNAKKQPLRVHENILVFYREQPDYHPRLTEGHAPVHAFTKHTSDGPNYGRTLRDVRGGGSTRRHPTSVLDVPVVNNDDPQRVHPTQKPEALVAWFIETYTRPGDLVLDPTCGSGTTCVAARRLGRRCIGFEIDPAMACLAQTRLADVHPEGTCAETGT